MDKLALGEDGDEEDDEDYVPQEGEVDLNDLDHPTRRKGTRCHLQLTSTPFPFKMTSILTL